MMTGESGPNRPAPKSVSLDGKATAVVVLDIGPHQRDWAADQFSSFLRRLGDFLDRARAVGASIIFTLSAKARGTLHDGVAEPLMRREAEPVIYPDSYDKFGEGDLQNFLVSKGIRNLVLLGSGTNIAVLYTATTAARVHRYSVVIPIDGVIARTPYEQEYAFHQLSVFPGGTNKLIQFTTLSAITFG